MPKNDADDFARQLDEEMEEIDETVLLVSKGLAMRALNGVVLKSPVDTGRFRGNWNVGVGTMETTTTERVDPGGNATIGAGTATIDGMTRPMVVYVSNSLSYSGRIENGWSKQAPQGVVALTVAEIDTFGVEVVP